MTHVPFHADVPDAYFSSAVTVCVAGDTVTLRPRGQPPGELETPCGVITAMNPAGVMQDEPANVLASVALHALLHRRGHKHVKSVSFAPDGTHVEHGWLVWGVTKDELKMFGRAFGQTAVYWIDRHVDVVACR